VHPQESGEEERHPRKVNEYKRKGVLTMRKMVLAWLAVLAVSASAWATGLEQTCGIGLCNPCLLTGGFLPALPCMPNPCIPWGGCEVSSTMISVTHCQMTGPCGGIGMATECMITSSIGGLSNPQMPAVLTAHMAILDSHGNVLLETHLP
jgi:hypothetical protein